MRIPDSTCTSILHYGSDNVKHADALALVQHFTGVTFKKVQHSSSFVGSVSNVI